MVGEIWIADHRGHYTQITDLVKGKNITVGWFRYPAVAVSYCQVSKYKNIYIYTSQIWSIPKPEFSSNKLYERKTIPHKFLPTKKSPPTWTRGVCPGIFAHKLVKLYKGDEFPKKSWSFSSKKHEPQQQILVFGFLVIMSGGFPPPSETCFRTSDWIISRRFAVKIKKRCSNITYKVGPYQLQIGLQPL